MLARYDDDHARDGVIYQKRMRQARRETRFPRARRRDEKRVFRTLRDPSLKRFTLPRT